MNLLRVFPANVFDGFNLRFASLSAQTTSTYSTLNDYVLISWADILLDAFFVNDALLYSC